MILASGSITQAIQNGDLILDPFNVELLKDASYTFTLHPTIRLPRSTPLVSLDAKPSCDEIVMSNEGFILQPNAFVLGQTQEKLSLNGKFGCFLSTRGSCAQLGLSMLLSSTFAEPDTDGPLVIEIHNASANPILLLPGMKVVKGIFSRVE